MKPDEEAVVDRCRFDIMLVVVAAGPVAAASLSLCAPRLRVGDADGAAEDDDEEAGDASVLEAGAAAAEAAAALAAAGARGGRPAACTAEAGTTAAAATSAGADRGAGGAGLCTNWQVVPRLQCPFLWKSKQ